jgi:hypothetical protein
MPTTLSSADKLTAIELAKRFGKNDQILIIEGLSVQNEMLLDAPVFEATDGTINKTTVRQTMPSGKRRIYNEGIMPSASQTGQIEDRICMLEDYSDVDKDLADHSPDKNAFLDSEDKAFLMGMGKTQADALIYDSHFVDSRQIDGLAMRYPALADTYNVYGLSGTGNALTSGYLIRWGRATAHLFYPRGHESIGVKREFRGVTDIIKTNSEGKLVKMPGYSTFFSAHFGMSVRDKRAVKRLCNIPQTGVAGDAILTALIKARNTLPAGDGNTVFYCNSFVKSLLDIYAMTKSNGCYTADDPWGRPCTIFQGIRIRQMDSILNTESAVA